ncbi:MAG: hypothetical protein ACRCWS_03485 [Propionibacteriaceae bacterium]
MKTFPPPGWVHADPFRIHIQTLMTQTGLPWRVLALAADVPSPAVRTLVQGRHGQFRPFLLQEHAEALFALCSRGLAEQSLRYVPAGHARWIVNRLLRDGLTVAEIARLCRVAEPEIAVLCGYRAQRVRSLTELFLRAVAEIRNLPERGEIGHFSGSTTDAVIKIAA